MERFEELQKKRVEIISGGGDSNRGIQLSKGKMTARERIKYLLDESSFVEVGGLIKGSGVITGYGTIDSKLVYIYSEDFTVNGGLLNKKNADKILNIMSMALKMGAPLIKIVDSLGGDISEGMRVLASYGSILNMHSKLSGVVPQITIIAGPCTGTAALGACMSDIVIMTSNGELYVNSSERIEMQNRTYCDYSIYATATTGSNNGSVQVITKNDEEAMTAVRQILSYIPQNNLQVPSFTENRLIESEIDEDLDKLYSLGNLSYKELVASIADRDSMLEMNSGFGPSIYTAFIKLNGLPIGIMGANSSKTLGIDTSDCEKATRFVKLCNAFNISILSLVDVTGFVGSIAEEVNGLGSSAGRLVYVLSEANVPKVSLIIGSSIGVGHIAFASKEASFDMAYALPNAIICMADPTLIVKQIYGEQIKSAENPRDKEKELLKQYLTEDASAFKAAEDGHIDDIIKPSEARTVLLSAFDMLESKREIKYPKKHGSVLI